MKHLNQYIVEKFKIKKDIQIEIMDIKLLTKLLKDIVLVNQDKIVKSDFQDWKTGMYTLYNVPQDEKYYKEFIDKLEKYSDDLQFLKNPKRDFKHAIGIKGDDQTCIIFNFMDENDTLGGKKGDINSIDVSKNIMELLIK